MNYRGIHAIYKFEMGRTLRTLGQSIASPVISTVLYFIVFGSAIGSRIEVTANGKKQMKELQSQSSFLSCSDFRLHFGLGSAPTADVNLRWPNGQRQTFTGLKADQLYTIKEGAGIVANRGWK